MSTHVYMVTDEKWSSENPIPLLFVVVRLRTTNKRGNIFSEDHFSFPIEKEEEEAEKAAEAATKGKEPEKPQYNYPIRVKCGIAVTEIEWTTEVTDQKLNTTTTVTNSEFEKFGMEMDHRWG